MSKANSLNDFIKRNKHQLSKFNVVVQRGDEFAVCTKKSAPAWAEFGWVVVHEGEDVPEPKGAKRSRKSDSSSDE